MGSMDDVANAAKFFATDLSAFVSGQQLLVSGGAPASLNSGVER
jgi:3-oxoacyl-[acyl-carrier protein] reductase